MCLYNTQKHFFFCFATCQQLNPVLQPCETFALPLSYIPRLIKYFQSKTIISHITKLLLLRKPTEFKERMEMINLQKLLQKLNELHLVCFCTTMPLHCYSQELETS